MANIGKLDRRGFLVGSSTVALLALESQASAAKLLAAMPGAAPKSSADHVYARTLHFVYARSGGKAFGNTYSDDDFLKFFDQVPGGVTAAIPFLLNVADASVYAPMINKMKAKGIAIYPGVGQKPGDGPINVPKYKDMAKNYRPFTDCIRLENTQGYFEAHGPEPIQDLIDYCVGLGFKHIMLNPWPKQAGGEVYPFKNPELDSTIYQVLLKHDRKTHKLIPDPQNWFPGNQVKIDAVRKYRPSIAVLINYESAPQHEVLEQMEKDEKGSTIAAMEITARMIEQSKKNLHWSPPFTTIYDPVKLGTWSWMAKRLGDFKG
ncbi:hypothetical protein HZY97_01980 [Sphingomonas sp. R-74633]|uniref:hypothetical protein n=1 Tax=Sphingomonas sp. R-74633 TaxID=2751188 RepID=UPI0015D46356|nr:hypothetical protein [Sphingomonas sp. R-74633]NYT39511.1 hypothetical protein [Sphingomonas sp. R-74633]